MKDNLARKTKLTLVASPLESPAEHPESPVGNRVDRSIDTVLKTRAEKTTRIEKTTQIEKTVPTPLDPALIVPDAITSGTTPPPWWRKESSRWLSSLSIVLVAHAAPIAWWLLPDNTAAANTPPPAAMVIELAPAPVAPPSKPDMPPGPERDEVTPPPKPKPEPEPEQPPVPEAKKPDVAVKPKTEAKPEQKLQPDTPPEPKDQEDVPEPESIASAPADANHEDAKAAAPNQGVVAPAVQSTSIPTWQNSLMLKLNEAKRYPARARRAREEGVSYLRFTMDREGKVLAKSIERTAGHPLLDKETLELIDRAQPLPKPPAEMPGETLEFVVPVEFFLNR